MIRQMFRRILSAILPVSSHALPTAPVGRFKRTLNTTVRRTLHLYVPYGGKREIARRKSQIERGIIRISQVKQVPSHA